MEGRRQLSHSRLVGGKKAVISQPFSWREEDAKLISQKSLVGGKKAVISQPFSWREEDAKLISQKKFSRREEGSYLTTV